MKLGLVRDSYSMLGLSRNRHFLVVRIVRIREIITTYAYVKWYTTLRVYYDHARLTNWRPHRSLRRALLWYLGNIIIFLLVASIADSIEHILLL